MRTATGQVELIVDGGHLQRVVYEGMLKAKVSLDVATADFKAMLIPYGQRAARSVVAEFMRMADRGVEIRVLHSGIPSSAALAELRGTMPAGLTIRRCPRLHSKLVIVDCNAMYLGSANLTGAGLGAKGAQRRNFEMGVWSRSTVLIDAALQQFNALWESERCTDCGRHDICPVPLEEPMLS